MVDLQVNSTWSSFIRPFRTCSLTDFTKRNYHPDESFKSIISEFFCPKVDDFEQYFVEGKYANTTYRMSFSIQMHVCSKASNPNCKQPKEIDSFLEEYYFTFYNLKERVEFSLKTLNKNPLITANSFHSQFQLDRKHYRDNNNFLRPNLVKANDNRWTLIETSHEYLYVDVQTQPAWIG